MVANHQICFFVRFFSLRAILFFIWKSLGFRVSGKTRKNTYISSKFITNLAEGKCLSYDNAKKDFFVVIKTQFTLLSDEPPEANFF